jgi:hypothetical protein
VGLARRDLNLTLCLAGEDPPFSLCTGEGEIRSSLKKPYYFAQALAAAAIVARCIHGLSTILLALTRNQVTMLAAILKLAQTGQENRSCSCSAFCSA